MKAGASDHKGSSDESTLSPSPLALYADLIRNCREYASFRLYAKSLKDIPSLWRFFQNRNVEVYIKVAEIEAVQTLDRSFSIVFGLIAGAALFGFMASTASSTLAGVRRKSRSLGIMRLLGFPRAAILLFPMSQAAVTGLLGSFLAGLLYLIVALSIDRLFSASLPSGQQAICVLPTLHMAAVFALVPLLSALSSLFAARQAITIEPSEVIRDV
jgi:putative ABC transport system permease protein